MVQDILNIGNLVSMHDRNSSDAIEAGLLGGTALHVISREAVSPRLTLSVHNGGVSDFS
jgi:hypothetical protein